MLHVSVSTPVHWRLLCLAWLSMAQHGSAWLSMAQHGSAWLSMAQHGSAWVSMGQAGLSEGAVTGGLAAAVLGKP